MKKRIMIIGAGRGQVGLIQASKRLGYTTIVASIPGNYPGFDYADEICYVDISNPEEVYESAKSLNIDGIATACLDTGIVSVGYVCDKLNLCGLSYRAAKISNDKLLMKDAFEKYGVNTAKYRKISCEDDLHKACKDLTFPLILKAVDLQGSRGIYICRDIQSVIENYSKVSEETKKDYCIIEEFIEGEEFGAQAFVYDNEVLFVMPTGNETYLSSTNIPVGHFVPYLEKDVDSRVIEDQVKRAINALGFNNCAINVDLIKKGNEYYVIELTGRVGANCLPELTQIYYDISYYDMIATLSVRDERFQSMMKTEYKSYGAGYAKMLFSEKSGTIKSIECGLKNEDYVYEVTFFVKPGETVNKFRNSKDCIGQVIVKGKDMEDCNKNMQRLLDSIKIEFSE